MSLRSLIEELRVLVEQNGKAPRPALAAEKTGKKTLQKQKGAHKKWLARQKQIQKEKEAKAKAIKAKIEKAARESRKKANAARIAAAREAAARKSGGGT